MVLYKTKSRGGVSIVYIVPMCCLSGTSNKEHTFKVMRGGLSGELFRLWKSILEQRVHGARCIRTGKAMHEKRGPMGGGWQANDCIMGKLTNSSAQK